MAGFSGAFFLVTIVATLTFITSTVIQPFFTLYVNEVVSSSFELGMIISLMSYTTLATRLPLGLATSKIGSWWVIPFALIGQSSSYILYSFATQDQHFYLIRIFHAIALASLQPTLMSIASILSPEGRKGEAIGIYLTSVGLAMMGGPLLCSFLLSYFNYRTIFILAAIIPLIIVPLYVSLLRNTALKTQLSETTDYDTLRELGRGFKEIITRKPVQSLTYGRFTFAFTSSIIATLYGIYAVTELKIDPTIYALFFTLRGLANTVLRLPTGRISDTIGRKKPLITSFILFTLIFLFLSEVVDPLLIGVVMFFYGVGHGIRAVSEWSFFGDVVSRRNRSLANFYFSSVFDFGSALGATFAGSAAMLLPIPSILKMAAAIVGSSVLIIGFTKVPNDDAI